MYNKLAFIDTETTGLHPELCDIWEIAIIVDDKEYVFHPEISRSAHVDDWVREHTRFSEYGELEHQPPWEVIEQVCDLIGGRHLVGACTWFDSERLHRMYRNYHAGGNVLEGANHPWHYHLLDIEALCIGYLQGSTNKGFSVGLPWKHDELVSMIDPSLVQDPETKHTAIGDCRQVKRVFEWLFGSA